MLDEPGFGVTKESCTVASSALKAENCFFILYTIIYKAGFLILVKFNLSVFLFMEWVLVSSLKNSLTSAKS